MSMPFSMIDRFRAAGGEARLTIEVQWNRFHVSELRILIIPKSSTS
jgi:hypothetical protein